jgi:hypothetical protein
VSQLVVQLVTAAIVGALSPVATMATIALLAGEHRPLGNAFAMLCGWTLLLIVLAGFILLLFGGSGPALSNSTKAAFNVVIGLLLLSFGSRNLIGARHPLAHVVAGTSGRPRPCLTGCARWIRSPR